MTRHDQESHLSQREQQIATLVGMGKTNIEIAQSLELAQNTVKNYLSNILRKTGCRHRTELALWVADQRPLRDAAGC